MPGAVEEMTPEQLALVRRTTPKIRALGEDVASWFYEGLFERHPPARHLFPPTLASQGGKLVDEVLFLASAAEDLPRFLGRARALGRRHRAYGVQAGDYVFVGEALVEAVRRASGDSWSAEAAAAWQRLYALISEAMLEGAAEDLFSASA